VSQTSPFDLTELKKALNSGRPAINSFKQTLGDYRAASYERFRQGEAVEILVKERAAFIDQILQVAWDSFEWEQNSSRWWKTRISLLAVGGYGRGELHPHSDIDLLILLERGNYEKHQENIQSFTTLLWDIGLEVGHSVRSVKECQVQARNDVSIITSMMEARTITGDDELRLRMTKQITTKKIWTAVKFYRAKLAEQQERHQKYNHTEYSLEPNVKTSPGGLRDIQTVMWIARRKFDTTRFSNLVELDFLTDEEAEVLRSGQRLLWKIRFGLHVITEKDDDRLLFSYQEQLAKLFGYEDGDQLAVEQFMQAYYRAAMQIYATNELLLQHFDEHIVRDNENVKHRNIDERFKIHDGYLEVQHDDVFKDHPPALLQLFLNVGTNEEIQGVRASTIRLVRNHVYLIDDEFRANPECTALFMGLLASSKRLFSQLRRMERYGVLGAYLPEFGRIIGQMQFDLFHIYTVDAHTLQVVRNMRRFRHRDQEQRFPIAAHIHHRLPKVELLYIAGIYHDIAKGLGGDHSELGVEYAIKFCQRHALTPWDTNMVSWLVRNHLVMSSTSQRKDISDPDVIREFATLVQDQVRLDYLYALTVADINATNPTLWNSWRASLMRQLYLETKKALRHGLENYADREQYAEESRQSATEKLLERELTVDQVKATWAGLGDEYFWKEDVPDIVWQAENIALHDLTSGPMVLIRDTGSRRGYEGATSIFIYMQDQQRLFATVVTTLGNLNLNIVDARIATADDGRVFDTFLILDANGRPVGDDTQRQAKIISTIKRQLESGVVEPVSRRIPRRLEHFSSRTQVIISNRADDYFTVLEINAADRPGLLSLIATILADQSISVINAKITTLGERIEDVFFIVDETGQPLTDESRSVKLQQALCEQIDELVGLT